MEAHRFWLERIGEESQVPSDVLPEVTHPVRLFETLYEHYSELVQWNPRLSLVGPGTAEEVLARHYGESLAGVRWIRGDDETLVDLGSGGGFPGLVLAAALPRLQVTLIEARQRKWAFLKSSIRRCGLSSRCLDARVEASLPAELPARIDVVTCRAVHLPARFFEVVLDHSPNARFVLWQGESPLDLPTNAQVSGESRLPGSQHRRIVEVRAR